MVLYYSSAAIIPGISGCVKSHPYWHGLSLELSCYYWCSCSMLGDLTIPVDSLSISFGMGLSITLKVGVKLPGWLQGAVGQWGLRSCISYFIQKKYIA